MNEPKIMLFAVHSVNNIIHPTQNIILRHIDLAGFNSSILARVMRPSTSELHGQTSKRLSDRFLIKVFPL
jgi:hypothetical protein